MAGDTSRVVPTDLASIGPLYTTAEVAKLFRVNQRTVQEWIRTGTLAARRYGKVLRIREADLVTFGEVLSPRPASTPPGELADGQGVE